MAASTGVIVANIYYIQPLLADIARTFGLSVTKVGSVAMLTQIGTALGMLLFVPLGDTKERRSLITTLLIVAALALMLVATARNGVWLALACFVVGAMGSSVHLFLPFAAHLAAPEERGRVVGSVFSGILLGILLARTFSGTVGAHLGWRAVYGIASVLTLSVAILVQFLLPRSKPVAELTYLSLLRSMVNLIRVHPELRESAFLGASLFCCFSAFWTTLVFLLETPPYHYGSQAAGLFGLVGAAGAAGAPLVGRFTDSHGPRFAIGAALLAVLASYLVLWGTGKTLVGLIVGVLLMDVGVQAGHVANQARIYSLAPDARSRLNMFYMVCYFAGGAAGSFLGAYAWRIRGWTGVCVFCLGLMLMALVRFSAGRATVASPAQPDPPTMVS
ncbi:MAG TPA: MFS transporter [Candidatus Cybelea sp.]|jgi:predicted MFS family arabinose efflux permease|nr:MFS transporter [Candidatus Cybelea sp.]